ncbi:MAG: acyltransferase family protein [Bacteroidaceae bacterium]|nr:acyltransferase family protein [Bacteroidaceae bacterium]
MDKERDYSIDVVAGILVIHMILGHCIIRAKAKDLYLYNIMNYLYFFMPWFFFKSGMFYKSRQLSERLTYEGRKLGIPFLIYSIIGSIMYGVMNFLQDSFTAKQMFIKPIKELLKEGSIMGNRPLWFLFSLFAVLIIADILHEYKIKVAYVITSCFLLSLMLYIIDFRHPFYLSNVITGLCFLYLGIYFKSLQYKRYIFYTCIVLYAIFCIWGLTRVDMRENKLIEGSYILYVPTCIFGIVSINNIVRYMPFKLRLLAYVGRNSMDFYVLHWILLYLVDILLILFDRELSGLNLLLCYVLTEIILLPLYCSIMGIKQK